MQQQRRDRSKRSCVDSCAAGSTASERNLRGDMITCCGELERTAGERRGHTGAARGLSAARPAAHSRLLSVAAAALQAQICLRVCRALALLQHNHARTVQQALWRPVAAVARLTPR